MYAEGKHFVIVHIDFGQNLELGPFLIRPKTTEMSQYYIVGILLFCRKPHINIRCVLDNFRDY